MLIYKNFITNEELSFNNKREHIDWSNKVSSSVSGQFQLISDDTELINNSHEQPEPTIIDRIPHPSKDPKKLKKQIDFLQCWDRLRLLKKEVAEYLSNGQYGDAQDRQRDIENLYRRHPALRYKIS